MSYSFNNACWNCKNNETCTDNDKVQGAINDIHETTTEDGHKGSGEILLLCHNHDQGCPEQEEGEDTTG